MNTFLKDDDVWALSLTVTGRCNCNCSYCHFYARRDRKEFSLDMSDELFDNYLKLINEIKDKFHKNIQVRFSGGEPLILGDRIFELSNRMYEVTGIEPFVLTNGRLLNKEIIEKSKKNHISSFCVSIENPFDEADGAPKTKEVLKTIKEFDSEDLRVIPAIMIIKNNMFKKMLDIADYVYNEVGLLPSFAELTYQAYESPTDEELNDLYTNVKAIARKYYNKTPIRIFPYISPELYIDNHRNYLSELDLENSLNLTSDTNMKDVIPKMLKKLDKSYVPNPCENKNCDWFEDCRILKWLWFYPTNNVSKETKLNDYCRFKKVLNNALFEGITESLNVQ